MKYLFFDNTNTTLMRIDDDGICRVSCSADDTEYKKWLAEGNTPEPAFTDEELSALNNEKLIKGAKIFLADTDWIVTKITEAALKNEDTAPLMEKYAEALVQREQMRELINNLES